MSMLSFFRSTTPARENWFSRYSDLGIVAGIIMIIALMVLPLPAWAMDFLVAINIASGVVLLLLGIYIVSPLEFSVFPSVLLITTLFRLAISIATTRMILLDGHAGHIIDAFGKVVAGGNLVVGLVVFLIITVVQFIVIAKGAERVAEVAARFSLDAMPGKQLSIDSDLRSGLIDKDEAKRRRRALEQESKLHGSLDGAMKFVKGDAIAGIVIIVINLLGGLAVGVMQQGLDISTAMARYSILTIGEGMVAQIPALLGAMAAGLIVTRTGDDEDKHLGDAVRKQLIAKPRVLIVAGGICLLLAVVPGFPKLVFVLLALVLGGAGVLLTPALRERIRTMRSPAVRGLVDKLDAPQPITQTAVPQARPAVPLLLQVPAPMLAAKDAREFQIALEAVLEEFQLSLGLPLPRIHLHGDPSGAARWELLAFEVPIAAGDANGGTTPIVAAVRESLGRHASLFLGMQDTMNLLARAQHDMPEVVKETLRVVPIQRVADVLRRLVAESVSIRNLRDILETLHDVGQRDKDPLVLAENTRYGLRRQISHQVAPTGKLTAVILDVDIEEALRKCIRPGQPIAVDPQTHKRILETFLAAIRAQKPGAIVVPPDLRWPIRKLIERDAFETPVIAFGELMPDVQLDIRERLKLPARAPLKEAA